MCSLSAKTGSWPPTTDFWNWPFATVRKFAVTTAIGSECPSKHVITSMPNALLAVLFAAFFTGLFRWPYPQVALACCRQHHGYRSREIASRYALRPEQTGPSWAENLRRFLRK
jgi:hypothetical protein